MSATLLRRRAPWFAVNQANEVRIRVTVDGVTFEHCFHGDNALEQADVWVWENEPADFVLQSITHTYCVYGRPS